MSDIGLELDEREPEGKPDRWDDPQECFMDLLALHCADRQTAAQKRHYVALFEHVREFLGLDYPDMGGMLELAKEKQSATA